MHLYNDEYDCRGARVVCATQWAPLTAVAKQTPGSATVGAASPVGGVTRVSRIASASPCKVGDIIIQGKVMLKFH